MLKFTDFFKEVNEVLKQAKLIAIISIVGYCAVHPFISELEQKPDTELPPEPIAKVKMPEIKELKLKSESLPDFSQYRDVKQKKNAFFGYLAPLVRQINKEMLDYRAFVSSLNSEPQSEEANAFFLKVANKFHIKTDQSFDAIKQEMLLRIDAIPVELVLMQAANESAWGTSRFALVANNLFGQWCFKPGCGVVPSGRPEGERYEVRKFNHPIDSIRSYFNNLNTGHAYVSMRAIRLELRENNQDLDAQKVAEGLLSYSIRREAYIKEIQAMIRINTKFIPSAEG